MTETEIRTNQYPGACVSCGSRVAAEEGSLSRLDGRWVVSHLVCPQVEPEPAPEPAPEVPTADLTVWPGVYTVISGERHRTFRVRVQPSDAKFAPGTTILEYLAGRNNEEDYTGFAFIKDGKLALWKRFREEGELAEDARAFLADPEAALVAKHCARCHRTLTTPQSIAVGYGPECSRKGLR